jgi:hypothetical protein
LLPPTQQGLERVGLEFGYDEKTIARLKFFFRSLEENYGTIGGWDKSVRMWWIYKLYWPALQLYLINLGYDIELSFEEDVISGDYRLRTD